MLPPNSIDDLPIYGFTVFCDDIRTEVDGKLTFIGSYRGAMFIHSPFPATIPKFGFGVALWEREDEAFKRDRGFTLNIYLPGDAENQPTLKFDIPLEVDRLVMAKAMLPSLESVNLPKFFRMDFPIVVAGLIIREQGLIKVRAKFGDDVIKLGTLRVIPAPPPTSDNKPAPSTPDSKAV